MDPITPERLTFAVSSEQRVSALWLLPRAARACFVFAHGAGAGMEHSFMRDTAQSLADLGIATLRYQFPYMERGSRRADPPPVCHATVRAAVSEAARLASGLPLFAGGRSFGGRMTSQAQAIQALPGVLGLAFLGFPLHPAGKPSDARGLHLLEVHLPLLFLQGTKDELASLPLLESLLARLGERARLKCLAEADHSFHVPARSGRTDAQVREELLQALAAWVDGICTGAGRATGAYPGAAD